MKKCWLVIVIFLFFIPLSLFSFSFEPISSNYSPSGPRANQLFRIVNTEKGKIAVRVSVTTREIDSEGNETNVPVPELFMVYPSRMVLEAGESRSVRVKWNGDPDPPRELAFRIIAEQIPVEFEPNERTDGAGIRLTYRYMGNIYILPHGAAPEVVLTSHELRGNNLVLNMENKGSRHTLLENLAVYFNSLKGERILSLAAPELPGVEGENLLAGDERRFVVTLSREAAALLAAETWEVEFDFDPVF